MGEKIIRTVTAAVMAATVLALSVVFSLSKKQEFSENENRYLGSLPHLKWETIKNGEYMGDINSYLCDHFPFRDFFIGLKSQVEICLGKREINQVYIGKEGYLIEVYQKPVNTERITQVFRDFAEKEKIKPLEMNLMLVPTAIYVYGDKLPKLASPRNQMETAQEIYDACGIPAIDCSQKLLEYKDKGQLYYKLDHHWTTFGAYIGYLSFCEAKGITPVPLEEMESQVVTDEFCGTVYSKVNDYTKKGDSITIYRNPKDKLQVYYQDTNTLTHDLYNLEYTGQKDKYSLFLDNLHSIVEITNETADSGRELMLIKDSYANSIVPFLVRHYKKVYVFDTRYYKYGPSSFIDEHTGITDVLILYNMNTLDMDLGVGGIY